MTRQEDNRYGYKHAMYPYHKSEPIKAAINVEKIVNDCWGNNTLVTKAMKLHALMDQWWKMQKQLYPDRKHIALLDTEIKSLL